MPLLGTRGAASASGFGFTALTGIGGPYWIGTLGGAANDQGNGIAVDSSGNVYVTGYTSSQGSGGNDVLIAKYNNSGTIQWQRTLGGIDSDYGTSIAVDSSGNVYIGGYTRSQSAGGFDVLITKYNTSGTIQWQRTLGGSAFDYGTSIAVDSSGNVYVAGYAYSPSGGAQPDVLITKYDTSGTIQWQRTLGGSGYDFGYGIAVDSSGNVYITGYTDSQGSGGADVLIAKYNTSGTIQWQRTLGGANTDVGVDIAVDSSGNSYITGYTASQGSGNNDVLITKYDTSGTIQWQRILGGSDLEQGYSIAVDSSGNSYITGYTASQGAGGADVLIAKYNTSGTIQWQRTLGGANTDAGYGIAVDSSGSIFITGSTTSAGAGSSDLLITKLPGDGSKTGTYTVGGSSITYAASTLTAATSTLTSATSTLTSSTSTLTDATSTLTSSTSTLTSSVTTI